MKFFKLALIVEQDHLTASVWTFGLKGWGITRTEQAALPTADPLAEQVLAALRPLVLKWGLPPDTPVMVVAPAGIGGVLSFSFPKTARKDLDALVDFELAKALPFSAKEIERGYRAAAAGDRLDVSAIWLPRLWVSELKNALARAGLRLSELFHRSQLVGAALGKSHAAAPWACIEQDGRAVHFHFFCAGALADRSRRLHQDEATKPEQELALDLVALSSANRSPAVIYLAGVEKELRDALAKTSPVKLQALEQKPDFSALLLSLWNGGGNGVWLVPDKAVMAARLTPVMIAIALVGAVLSGVAWWIASQQRDGVDSLESEAKRLKPRYQKALAVEREALQAQAELDQIAATTAGPSPLVPFYRAFKALPEKAWLVGFSYSATEIGIEGYGVDGAELGEKLKQTGAFKDIAATGPQLAGDNARQSFALGMKWATMPDKASRP